MPPEVQTEISSEYDVSCWQSSSTARDGGEKAMRMAEVDRKRAELRHRMEAASLARKAKKGFMTPERKKKLRLLLRRKAAEELKKEQERKAEERRWIIEDRCGEPEDLEWASKDDLKDICDYYFQRIMEIESEKWDIEKEITKRAFEIADLNGKVNDLRGKFQRPILKKVSKYENKFAKLQRKAAEFNFRNQLKLVKRHDFSVKADAEDKRVHGDKKDDKKHLDETHDDSDAVSETGEGVEDSIADSSIAEDHHEGMEAVEGFDPTEGEKRLEEGEAEVGADGESRLGDQEVTTEGEARLDADQLGEAQTEREPRLEAEAEGAEEGEVQPAEPPPPIHTEDDLWDYLKETVTSVHPSTVEEFVQNLIGTLQHVPEEYLKPVIDANIKRVNSPSLTDGEHLTSPEHFEDGNLEPTESSVPTEAVQEGEDVTHSAECTHEWAPAESDATQEAPAEPDATQEAPQPPPMPEDQEAEGYSVVEAAA